MALTALLICLFVQRWLHFDSYTRQYPWFEHYYAWMEFHFHKTKMWSGILGVLIIVFPVLFIFILFAAFVYHVIGVIGYYALTLAILWYCLDARPLSEVMEDSWTPQELLVITYQRVFAVIFWLLIFGVDGVVLYYLVSSLRNFLSQQTTSSDNPLLTATVAVMGLLDWVPVRLLGMTFALVSHFTTTFKCWCHYLLTGLLHTHRQVGEVGWVALGLTEMPEMSATVEQTHLIEGLVNRSLLVWLVVIALFTIGMWIG